MKNAFSTVSVICLAMLLSSCDSKTENSADPTLNAFSNEAIPVVAEDASGASIPRVGKCHMGDCAWSKELSRKVLKENDESKLFVLSLIGGSSHHSDVSDYPNKFDKKLNISWNKKPHNIYVFCSKKIPSVMMKNGHSLQVDVLDFIKGPPGIMDSSASEYAFVCHNRDYISPEIAERLGYNEIPENLNDISINSPVEIFYYTNIKSVGVNALSRLSPSQINEFLGEGEGRCSVKDHNGAVIIQTRYNDEKFSSALSISGNMIMMRGQSNIDETGIMKIRDENNVTYMVDEVVMRYADGEDSGDVSTGTGRLSSSADPDSMHVRVTCTNF